MVSTVLNNGYLRIRFPGGKQEYVHRLIAKRFIGAIPKGYCVNHKDGNKLNNSVSNLEIVTLAENNHHAKRIGINMKGEKQHMAKLNRKQVLLIRKRSHQGVRGSYLSKIFNVSQQTICDINKKRTWGWL